MKVWPGTGQSLESPPFSLAGSTFFLRCAKNDFLFILSFSSFSNISRFLLFSNISLLLLLFGGGVFGLEGFVGIELFFSC